MMKLAYERPVMRAEAFATNAYCNSCNRTPNFGDTLTVTWKSLLGRVSTYLFSSSTKMSMINQDTGVEQYYYTGKNADTSDGDTYFLEYCATGKPNEKFFLYRDLEDSGYCMTEGEHEWYQHESDKSGVGTLQVAQGTYLFGWSTSAKTGLDWYADYNMGNVKYNQEVTFTQS